MKIWPEKDNLDLLNRKRTINFLFGEDVLLRIYHGKSPLNHHLGYFSNQRTSIFFSKPFKFKRRGKK